ncbi:MAG: hypothetical protein NTW42_08255 [Deltaproteobacteria bacterium]|nr:hypothetical protein [Deltaproteobacteria bacterium]
MRTICCVCRRVKSKGDWLEEMIESEVRVSHGFCPECFDKTMAQFSLTWSTARAAQPAFKPSSLSLLEQSDDVVCLVKTA